MQESIIKSMKLYIPDLVDLALKDRPDADFGSVEVTAAVVMLTSTIFMLNMAPRTARIEAAIDSIVDQLPKTMDDREVDLRQAIVEPEVLKRARARIHGAYITNLLGAFEAIYNTRISEDISRMNSMIDGPFKDLGGVCVVVGEALVEAGKVPPMLELLSILSKHFSNVMEVAIDSHSKNPAGSKACFIATACFESPNDSTVIILRQFRESVLKKFTLGRLFVFFYYRVSPSIVKILIRMPLLKQFVAFLLVILSRTLNSLLKLDHK